jgi:hypothetical protein
MRTRRLPTLGEALAGIGIAVPIWILVLVFWGFIPEIDSWAVAKWDRPTLIRARQVALYSSIATGLCSSILTLSIGFHFRAFKRRRTPAETPVNAVGTPEGAAKDLTATAPDSKGVSPNN